MCSFDIREGWSGKKTNGKWMIERNDRWDRARINILWNGLKLKWFQIIWQDVFWAIIIIIDFGYHCHNLILSLSLSLYVSFWICVYLISCCFVSVAAKHSSTKTIKKVNDYYWNRGEDQDLFLPWKQHCRKKIEMIKLLKRKTTNTRSTAAVSEAVATVVVVAAIKTTIAMTAHQFK